AGGFQFSTTVFPFILRNIRLQGVDSVHAPSEIRGRAWELLSESVTTDQLEASTRTIGLEQVLDTAEQLIKNEVSGRILIDVRA
ncbi:MAG: oxidoreductase, partial [Pseudomonadota bacterium]|nr:oxidoreductase [Pseudomonadota bacterium]